MARSCFSINIGNFNEFVRKVEEEPATGNVTFRTVTGWKGGAATETRARDYVLQADEPDELGGGDSGPNPVELLLAGVATCFVAGLTTRAARRGIDFKQLEVITEGDLDLRGYLGLDPQVRPGFANLRYTVRIESDADPEVLNQLIAEAHEHSPMVESIANGVRVERAVEIVN
ncbi:MAG TPA: OsmC family protein [Sphingobacteriaceae bacterium]|nr:OsmC family protein [Sphingobacteriaceae bacterium]